MEDSCQPRATEFRSSVSHDSLSHKEACLTQISATKRLTLSTRLSESSCSRFTEKPHGHFTTREFLFRISCLWSRDPTDGDAKKQTMQSFKDEATSRHYKRQDERANRLSFLESTLEVHLNICKHLTSLNTPSTPGLSGTRRLIRPNSVSQLLPGREWDGGT